MDAVKEYNRSKKDIALLIVLISSNCFEHSERLLSKETAVPRRWGSERLKLGGKQLHKGPISPSTDNQVDVPNVNPPSDQIE